MAVEEAKFQMVEAAGAFEIRDYPGLIVAEVSVSGERQAALNAGFRLLAAYIFGANGSGSKIAMTAPVSQSPAQGRQVTTPVIMAGESDSWTIQFTMPSAYALDDLPTPNDKRVQPRVVPPRRVGVLKFSGLTGDRRVALYAARLVRWLSERGFTIEGPLSLARYDPPWTPWFMRRNELLVQLAGEGKARRH